MSKIHARTLDRRIRSKERRALQVIWCAAIDVLLLTMATLAPAQDKTLAATGVEVRVQMSWGMEAARPHPLVASLALESLDRKGDLKNLRISENTTTIVRVPAGRYQLVTTSPLVINGRGYGWSIEVPLVAPVNYIRLSQENAVRLNLDDVIEAAQGTGPPASSGATDADAPVEITALFNRWTSSFKSRNLQAQMSCYAPRLVIYHERRNVSRGQVQLEERRLLRLYTRIRRFELSEIDISMEAGRARVSAVKTWNFTNDEVNWRGQTRIDFDLAENNSHWVITSERERPISERPAAEHQSAETSFYPH